MSAGSTSGSPTSPNGAATARCARTGSAQANVLDMNPPGRSTTQSNPDSRTVRSSSRSGACDAASGRVPAACEDSRTILGTPPAFTTSTIAGPSRCAPAPETSRKNASAPATTGRRLSGSARSAGHRGALRDTARTCSPAASRAATSGRPTLPVAPVTTYILTPSGSVVDHSGRTLIS
ncbi:hypothetical protein GCM10023107_11660 [Actinoplanes octamycinicus]